LRGDKDSEQQLKNRNYPQHMLDAALKNTRHPEIIAAGLRFSVPLTRFKYSLMNYLMYLLENYERGVLPFDGAPSEQPAQAIELLNLVQLLKQEYRNQQDKK
jgi:hypothetical protein